MRMLVQSRAETAQLSRFPLSQARPPFGMLAPMEPSPRASFEPAGAGALLGGVTAAGVGVGALVGWAAGSLGLGALVGALVGIPAGVLAVYRRYRRFFT